MGALASPFRPKRKSWPITTAAACSSSASSLVNASPGDTSKLLVEAKLQDRAQAGPLQHPPPLAPRREPRWRIRRREEFARHGLERQHHGRATEPPAVIQQGVDERPMPGMDPVKGTDGDDRAPMSRAQARKSANELHVRRQRSKAGSIGQEALNRRAAKQRARRASPRRAFFSRSGD